MVVIDFFATWCGPCMMIAPEIDRMDAQMPNVVYLKVDVDRTPDVSQYYRISAMPTFIFIKNGQKVGEMTGADVNRLRQYVSAYA